MKLSIRLFVPAVIGGFLLWSGLAARAWNITDLATGTNYISSPGTYTNQVYFSSYLVTNDTAISYSNLWVKMGPFTNGAGTPNISLQRGAPNKQNLGQLNASSSRAIFFCLNGTNSASSATNALSLYVGDPDSGGTLLTNILFALNYVVIVTQSANGSSAGTNFLSTTQPVLGGFLTITSTFTAGSASSKPGLYASYPAVSNGWDATTFTLVSNSFSILSVDTANDFTNFQNQIVGFVPWSKASAMTNIAVFRVVNTKQTTTPISSGAFVNTGNGAIPNYILPSDAGVLNPIPPATNRLTLTNWPGAASAYTNTTVYFTNYFANAAAMNVQFDDLICTLPPGFVYAGSPTFAGVGINAPAITNYVLTFSQGYVVPANGSAALVFAAVPTNAVTAAGNITNRAVLGTYSAYGLIGTNHIDLTYDTTDNLTPTNQVRVLLNPTATNDSYSVNEDTTLTVTAPGVLGNDNEPNGFAMTVSSYTQPAHGAVIVNTNGSFTYLSATNYNGSDSFAYTMTNGNARASTATVNLTVTAVNDPPGFTPGTNQTVLEDAGAQSVANWATNISAGPADEAGQTVTFLVANNNNSLFSAQPAISSGGTLTYTPAANANGSATVTVYLQDNGGTANGGNDTSATNAFTITVTAVNDPPGFTKGADQTVLEDAGAQSVANWATSISAGPANESGQALAFQASNDNNGLFSVQPSISPAGTLTFTPAANANGSATVTVWLQDNGGATNGGGNTSVTNTFTLTVTAVNDPPTLASLTDQTITEAAGLLTVNLSGISAGPTNESGQTLAVIATSSNPSLIPDPTVGYTSPNAAGTLTFTPVPNALGTSTVTVVVQDTGGTANGGTDSVTNTFTVTVLAVTNVWSPGGSFTVNVGDATGPAGSGFTQTNYTGYLDVQATGTNPFTIRLGSLNGGSAGPAANFNNNSNYTWTIATTTRVLEFDPAKFVVDTGAFSNDLAGGTFTIATNGNAVEMVFAPNHPPDAFPILLSRAWGTAMRIPISNVLTNFTADPDGDPTALSGMGVSTNGTPISTNSIFIFFTPTNNGSESFTYTIHDVRSYRPGDTVRTAIGWVTVSVTNAVGSVVSIASSGAAVTLHFAGVPGYAYDVEQSTNLGGAWTVVQTTNAPPHGLWIYTDSNPPQPSAFYRLRQH